MRTICLIYFFSLIFCFLSCKKESDFKIDKIQNSNKKIIYELEAETIEVIYKVYVNEKEKKFNDRFYVSFSEVNLSNESFKLTMNSCPENLSCIYNSELLKNNNRFLKLKNGVYLPVLFDSDFIFHKTKSKELASKVGGDKYFWIDTNGKISKTAIGM